MEAVQQIVAAIVGFDLAIWGLLVLGIILGLIVGVLPGLTFVMGVLLILPFTYGMATDTSIVLMLAVYLAGTYGGALTAVLLHIPGEPNNVPLLWDGYGMKKQGRAAEALGWVAISAFIGGLCSWFLLAFAAKPFASFALNFASPEYFAIVLLGLTSVLAFTGRAVTKPLISMFGGMLVSTFGVDSVYGAVRYDFIEPLRVGIEWVIVLVGIYALGEIIMRYAKSFAGDVSQQPDEVHTVFPSLRALKERSGSLARGTFLGATVGTVPGAGATVASFVAYGLEKQVGRYRHEVGKASISGVVAPQAAATGTVAAAFIPLLVLGIPGSASTAVILGALLLHNVRPSPMIFMTQPDLIYTIIAAMFIGLFLMFIIGVLAAKPLIRLLRVPEEYVGAFIVLFAFIGSFALRNSMSDVWIMTFFAVLSFVMLRNGYPLAPLVLGTILGPLAENYFLISMISFDNNWTIFFTRPLSGTFMAIWAVVLILLAYKTYKLSREPLSPPDRRAASRGYVPFEDEKLEE